MAYVVDPPGFETVPLPSGSFTCALGREIRVEVRGDTRWFKTWHAPNTLIDGSPEQSEVFRLGNLNPVVKASKRGYGSVTVAPPSHVTFSCMPVGDLSDAMYTEPDPLGGTRYCLPEGTLPCGLRDTTSIETSCAEGRALRQRAWGQQSSFLRSQRTWGGYQW